MKATRKLKPEEKKLYRARPGFMISDDDAQIIGEFCDELIQKHGTVSPKLFLREARHDKRVRHFIDWDNDHAAEQWRLTQARRLIVSFTVTVAREDKEVEVRAFHYVDSERGHQPINRIVEDKEMSELVLDRAKKDAVRWYHQYQNLRDVTSLAPIFDAMEKALSRELAQGPPRRGRPKKTMEAAA